MGPLMTSGMRFCLILVVGLILFGNTGAHAQKQNAETIWVNPPGSKPLPEGVSHHTYASPSMQHDVGYHIYLPPGYAKNADARYPVIYCLHGAGGMNARA